MRKNQSTVKIPVVNLTPGETAIEVIKPRMRRNLLLKVNLHILGEIL